MKSWWAANSACARLPADTALTGVSEMVSLFSSSRSKVEQSARVVASDLERLEARTRDIYDAHVQAYNELRAQHQAADGQVPGLQARLGGVAVERDALRDAGDRLQEQLNGSEMRNPHERCSRKKFVRQAKSASNNKKARTPYADSSSSSGGDYPIQSSESEGSDECPRPRDRWGRCGKQVKTAAVSSLVEELPEGNPSDEPVEPDDQMPSKDYVLHRKKEKNYVLQGKLDLTAAQKAKIDAIDEKIRPKIPMLVVRMKKTNVKLYSDLRGRKIYPSCQRGSSRDHRNTAKKAAKSTSFEKSGEESPLEYNSVKSDDRQTSRGHNYALSLGSCLSGAQYAKVIALKERIQPETAVYVDVMNQRAVELPSPLLIIPEEHAIAHFPNESVTITLEAPDKKSKKWHPRFYMTEDRSECMLIGHWLDFVCDNNVQEGDICIFIPEKGGMRSKFTVHLLRGETSHSGDGTGGVQVAGSDEGKTNTKYLTKHFICRRKCFLGSNVHRVSHEPLERNNSDGFIQKRKKSNGLVPPYILPAMTHLSPSQENIVEAKVQAIQSEVPIYVSIMKKRCISAIKHNMLELGSRYAAAAHLPPKNQNVLQCMGRIWNTEMVVHRNGKRCFLSGGWSKFVHDNDLQIGDICLFELKKNKRKLTMKVHIIPSKQC
ncbi:B3 domain-containing protein Os03g0619600-like [Hordeum vulgare subsp. vulgare]|uniref:B3 domain-containing protein Os03g0619600-like n=1 Tax=Hordeum vulgare subsp. vulgare TaxID=112509 RepID=UPI001D1A33A6|nr:B3 domain-containing protein Os03g0619600-like [Hordeum vulgare subsp. vulgare]